MFEFLSDDLMKGSSRKFIGSRLDVCFTVGVNCRGYKSDSRCVGYEKDGQSFSYGDVV